MKFDTIYNENCIETMSRMPNDYIDLVVTSPPYDNLRTYNNPVLNWNFDTFKPIAKELFRVVKVGGVVVWVVGDATVYGSETGSSFKQALYFLEIGFKLHDTMIYLKNGASYPSKNKYYQVFEYMFVFSNGEPKAINLLRDRKNKWAGQKWSKKRTRRNVKGELVDGSWDINQDNEYGVRFNMWQYNTGHGYSTKDKEAFKHPAIFPEQLAQDHIISWSNENDLVYDPFMGSGTTAKMAIINNRKTIGSEISKEYCEIAEKRIKEILVFKKNSGFVAV